MSCEDALQLRQLGDYEASRQMWLALLEADPSDPEIQYQTAWSHDLMGMEAQAVPYYERAIALNLSDAQDLRGAYLGLGSTYRTLGRYADAERTLMAGAAQYPNDRSFTVFLAMTLHNLGSHAQAMLLLLEVIADTSTDIHVQMYRKAIRFYSTQLERVWPADTPT